jgi:hypothetical protein
VGQACSCAGPGRGPAKQMELGRERAHCASNVGASPGFSSRKATFGKKSLARHDYWPRAAHVANPDFPMEFAGLPLGFRTSGISNVIGPRPSPKRVPAPHHLVTAVSIKKGLMGPIQLPSHLAEDPASSGPRPPRANFPNPPGESGRHRYLTSGSTDHSTGDARRTHPVKMPSGDRLCIARPPRPRNNNKRDSFLKMCRSAARFELSYAVRFVRIRWF